MNDPLDDSLRTHASLLERVRSLDDDMSWARFHARYRPFLLRVAAAAGLASADAEDVVQQALVAIAEEMPTFKYDPAKGSFRGWLKTVLSHRIATHFRATRRREARVVIGEERDPEDAQAWAQFDTRWEEEWESHLLERAIERLRGRVVARDLQVFDLATRHGWSVGRIAEAQSRTLAAVYLVRSRVGKQIKAALLEVRRELGE